ncbi:gluconate 2-dehydrogenase subunit 3 family protein [Endozoicomonas arenosclerae]|uniref:gluconate 2-dehydrogenase subunit 3 family protein n=1 Tax=Endozoicomonas arenosclerae TaxID=1633495 RepID=UPI000780EBCF|nr:gluconate 2-dehydrogenase subunit 3 family protein [Endozoicomonas arenosclerae]
MSNKQQDHSTHSHNRISRRLVLKLLALAPLCWEQTYAQLNNPEPVPPGVLPSVLDVLIPGDSTPGATDLKIEESLLDTASQIPRYPELIQQGTQWFNTTSLRSFYKPFPELAPNAQIRIVEAAFNQPEMTLPRVFIERIREDAMTLYYHNSASWTGMDINRPIQPLGYPDHEEPPGKL